MVKRVLGSFLIGFCLISPLLAADLTVDELISNLQASQSAIKDMSADTVTKITSTMKGAKDMVQKGKILTKYPDKSRVEMFEPIHQVTISDGKKIIILNKDNGQKYEQDISKAQGQPQGNQGQMNLDKAREYFDFSAKKDGDNYIIVGIPKADNKFLGKMEFVVDPTRWLTTKVKVYSPQGKLISETNMEYLQISDLPSGASAQEGVWIMTSTISSVSTPMGNMKMEMTYENVKVNKGIKDTEFKI